MNEHEEEWKRVLRAFEDWIEYESTEFGPWTGYFSIDNLRTLTDKERLGWMCHMRDEIIPGRVDHCRMAGIALEDFLPFMPDMESIGTVRSMINLNHVIEEIMLKMSDVFSIMIEEYKTGGLDEIIPHLGELIEFEEDIRHHMSLYSKGFAQLSNAGFELPAES